MIPSDWWISRDQQVSINVLTFSGLMIADFFIFFSTEYIYTGTADGRILSIYKGQISTLAQLGKGDGCGKKCSCMNE